MVASQSISRQTVAIFVGAAALLLVAGAASAQDGGHGDHGHMGAGHTEMGVDNPDGDAGKVKLFVCESDPSVGQSFAGTCPLDGSALVETEVDTAEFTDLGNDRCPIMGGAADAGIFAVYKGKAVHFCCPGCAAAYFKDAEAHLTKLEGAGN